MFLQKKLSQGPNLVIAPIEGTKAVTVLILVGAGSRYESDPERGIAHFLEHMFFKGGKVYDSPKKVSEEIDRIGGDFNAFTGKEYAGYYVKCAGENVKTAFSVLGDMLMDTKLDINDINKERGVIIEELNMYQDTPMYQIGWDFERLLFGDTPMGRDQIGLKETILAFSEEDFRQYRHDLYTSENTVIVVAGDITEEKAEALTKQYFAFDDRKKSRKTSPAHIEEKKKVIIREKRTEQAHLIIGFEGVPFGHPEEFAARLLAIILGGNMSSRMFLNIREQKGLCYSISTSTDQYSDVGVLSTHCGVDLQRTEEAISAVAHEYYELAKNGVEEDEVTKAKSFLRGKLTLKMEDSEERASFLGTQAILGAKIRTVDELFAHIESITKSDIDTLAARILKPENCRLAAIGPFAGLEEKFSELIQ